MLRVEFHCHTIHSKDCLISLDRLLDTCRNKEIHRIVITDHNTIEGAVLAHRLDPKRVIVGEEIMTQTGELLATYVTEEIPPGLPPIEVISRLREQEAFITISHPFDRLRSGGWRLTDLIRISPLVDAIETFNARNMWPGSNPRAKKFADENHIPNIVGSDAHSHSEVGKATMVLPDFQDTGSLRQALYQARIKTSHSKPWVHLFSRYAAWRKKVRR